MRNFIFLFGFFTFAVTTQCFFSKSLLFAAGKIRSFDNEFFIVLKNQPAKPGEINYQKNKMTLSQLEKKISDLNGQVLSTYMNAFVGIHVRIPLVKLSDIMTDKRIDFIEKNAEVELYNENEDSATWGIDRIDQRDLPLDSIYKSPYKGNGVHSYIIDTGIRPTHNEFKDFVGEGFSALENDSSTDDCNGHGTHVAGTVVGKSVGVSRQTRVYPVRVFSCSGGSSWDIIIKSIDWVIANHKKPANINMSLGGGGNQAIDTAVKNAVDSGISVVVAAGNSNADACNSSPAREKSAITVAASTSSDYRASFSNWGSCVDLFAPGQSIKSASHNSDDGYQTFSGTSMAAPHVAGAVSLIQSIYPKWTPYEITEALLDSTSKEKITDVKGSPNHLLFVNDFGGVPSVDAGSDLVIRLPRNSVTLSGKTSDEDGFILSTSWEKISGPNIMMETTKFSWEHTLTLTKLVEGNYVFAFTATDNDGLSASDTVEVLVTSENLKPIADAGNDIRVNLGENFTMNGEGSYDRDGTVDFYSWVKVSGPDSAQIENPNASETLVNNASSGNYVFKLAIEDNEGGQAEDNLKVHVNHPPSVDLGDDLELILPKNSVSLEALVSDPEENKLYYQWFQESGPSKAKIESPDQSTTLVNNLQEGVYLFRLVVQDEFKAEDSDIIQVTVINKNEKPVVSAGDDVTLILPDNSVVLRGSCYDKDGKCISVRWSLINANSLLEGPQETLDSDLYLNSLEVGSYLFRFSGIDDEDAVSSDQVLVTVKDDI